MGEYIINGGNKLRGKIKINGSKNAILPILASTVLNNGISILHNCPRISDTFIALDILKDIGCKIMFKEEEKTIIVDSSSLNKTELSENLVCKMRSSIIFLGSILGRFKKVKISLPGGCELGARPIDFHLKAIKKMGASIVEDENFITCHADKLEGKTISFDFPSVGATENVMLAAVLSKGTTIIKNAAREPEIIDLQIFLNKMGAKIMGAGTNVIVIDGVKKLHNAEHYIIPDRIEAGTYLAAAAITGGEVTIENVIPAHMSSFTSKFVEMGCIIKEEKNSICINSPRSLKNVKKLSTLPYPGFPTDMQPQIMSLLTLSEGTSIIIETVFEARDKHISELNKMGANIEVIDKKTFIVRGVKKLNGATVQAKDLRGGASLILAGLSAEGTTCVKNSIHVERGYENIEKILLSIGADIKFKNSGII